MGSHLSLNVRQNRYGFVPHSFPAEKAKEQKHETQTGYDTFFQHLASIDKLVSS